MNDQLLALRVFARTAVTGSFSRAGRELGLSQPSVSRILAELERDLGVPLLVRTTRAMSLTEAGTSYLARVEQILAALAEADHAVRGTGELKGVLRIALSTSFGVREVIPRLPAFLERHPSLRVDIGIKDTHQGLSGEGVDVALWLGKLEDSSMVARKLAQAPRLVLASSAYLDRAGRPQTPADLAGHRILLGPGSPNPDIWSFARKDETSSIRVDGRITVAANEGLIAAATAGLGIAVTSLWGCRAELTRGALVTLLDDWRLEPTELHAVFPTGHTVSPAARLFVDYLAASLS